MLYKKTDNVFFVNKQNKIYVMIVSLNQFPHQQIIVPFVLVSRNNFQQQTESKFSSKYIAIEIIAKSKHITSNKSTIQTVQLRIFF